MENLVKSFYVLIFLQYIFLYMTLKKLKIKFSPKTVIMGLDFNTDFS